MPHVEVSLNQEDGVSLGMRLSAAREKLGVPMEQAAHDTRIRAQRLRELEADDYSRFPHPSYARMFLMDYSKYLGIPLGEIRGCLPDPGECGAGGYQYLQELSGETVADPVARRIKPRRRLLPAFGALASLLLVAFIGLQVTMTLRKLDSLGFGKPTESAAPKPVEVKMAEPAAQIIAEDVAVLEELVVPPVQEAVSVPAALTVPTTVHDDRAAFFVGGTLDPSGQVQ